MIWQRLTPFRIALLVGLMLSAMRFAGCQYLDVIDLRALDYRFVERGIRPASPDVVIVGIDDASLEKVGRWPWSRGVMAQLVDRLSAAEPAAIGFDIVQSEATSAPRLDALREHVEGVDDRTREAVQRALNRGAADDELLAAAVRASGRSVLGYFFDFSVRSTDALAPRVSTYNLVQNSRSGRGEKRVPNASLARANLPSLTAAAREVGYFNFFTDSDGSFRRAPLTIRFQGQMALPLSLAMLRVARPHDPLAIRFADFGVESVRVGSVVVPLDEDGQMVINYRGPGKTFRHYSALDVLEGRIAPDVLRGKLVLVGLTAAASAESDVRVTPFDGMFPGVEIHANILDNILRSDFVSQPKWLVLAEIGVILVSVLVLGLGLHYARGVAGALLTAALLAGYVVGSQWVFVAAGLPLSLTYPVLAMTLTYMAIGVQHYAVEEREKRKIRDAFGLYLSPSLARLVSERPEMLALGGDKRELTVLFSDIRGFTTISERLEPEVLVELLNEFLGEMTDVIFRYDGMLDKYIGDAIMAVWGAPLQQPDHAARACNAALGMANRLLDVLDDNWKQRGWPVLDIGIGINTGPMVVGNMGSARRLSYTVIGDNVNLGSRLEGLNKMYGSRIIASEATVNAAGDIVVAREIDMVRVKGKRQPVRIFELLAPGTERQRWVPLMERFEAGIRSYRQQRWDDALDAFAATLKERPEDGPAKLYVERCREMRATPPGPEWDGVTVMEVK